MIDEPREPEERDAPVVATEEAAPPDTHLPEKPRLLVPTLTAIPPEIAGLPRWVVWRLEWDPGADGNPGRWTKRPYNPRSGTLASSTDPDTWGTFESARGRYSYGDMDGIGIVLGDGLAGVDFDHVVDPETGAIEPQALARIVSLDSYSEFSPSGTGVHVLLRGTLPPGRRRIGNIEMYDSGRYFTFTGCQVPGAPPAVAPRQAQLLALHAEVFPPPAALVRVATTGGNGTAPAAPPDLSSLPDEDLLRAAFASRKSAAIATLWNGTWEDRYSSQSEADLALLNHLAFYSGPDATRLERLFSGSGLAQRAKWGEREDYRAASIAKALEGRAEFYHPPRKKSGPRQPGSIGGSAPAGPGDPVLEGPLGLRLSIRETRRTATRLTVKARVELAGESIPIEFTGAQTSLESIANELLQILPRDADKKPDPSTKAALKKFLRQAVDLADSQPEPEKVAGETSITIMYREAAALNLAFRNEDSKAWSEKLGCFLWQRQFIEQMITQDALVKLQSAVDLEECGTAALISAAKKIAESVWATIMRSLPEQAEATLGGSSAAAQKVGQLITRLWTTHQIPDRSSDAKVSLAVLVCAHDQEPSEDPPRWHRVKKGYSAWWRRIPIEHPDDPVEYEVAMRWEILQQMQVVMSGVRDQRSFHAILVRYGFAVQKPLLLGEKRESSSTLLWRAHDGSLSCNGGENA